MRVKFWGVRGSLPTPLTTEQLQERIFRALSAAPGVNLADPAEVRAFIATLPPAVRGVVGGHTTCVEINVGDDILIIDCGSGMRALGTSLVSLHREFRRGLGVAHIFLTHAHWDHLQGFPFFAPAFIPGNKLIFYAVNHDPLSYFNHQQVAPTYFPITPSQMAADMQFVTLREGEKVQIGRTTVSTLALDHPGVAYAYRFDDGESIFVFASDGEYKSLDDASLRKYIDFYSNADALVFDCQFSLRDVLLSKYDWGHSSAMIGVEIAEKAGVRKLITTHYDISDSDEQIYEIAESARRYGELTPSQEAVEVIVGSEGLELFLGPPLDLEALADRETDIWLLAFAGKLSGETAAQAQTTLAEFLAAAPNHKALVDLTLISVIDMVGARALVAAAQAVDGSQLIFVAPAAFVRRNLDNAGAREAGPIFLNRSHALAASVGPAHLHLRDQMLAGYRLGNTITADEFGAVYSATHYDNPAPLVMQVLGVDVSAQQKDRFAKSTRAWCSLTHPRLVPGRALVEEGGLMAFVGERPPGQTWNDWLNANGKRLSPPVALQWIREMVEALDHAHRHDVAHGELRPECFVFNNGHARISRLPVFAPRITLPSAYRAPEQLRGDPPTPRSDQFVLGVMLYEAFIGAHPFAAEAEEQIIAQQLQGAPLSPRVFRPELSSDIEEFLLRLLARDPAERFADGEEILHALEKLS